MVPYEFLAGFIWGMLIMFGIFILAAIIRFVVDWVGDRTPFPSRADLIDGVIDDE